MADLRFSRATLAGLVTTVGARVQAFDDEAAALGLAPEEAERLKRAMGFSTRHVVADPGTTTADLCLHSARHLLRGLDLQPDAVDGLILVTQTPDYSSPSTSIGMQHRLGMRTDTLCFDIRLGCSGFVYGLSVAYSLVESGLDRVLLCVGDVASRMVATGDRSITPIMGDAGAAVLIERRESESFFQLHSDGSGEKALFIPHSGLRADAEDVDKPGTMHMDGAQVFNFTLKRVPPLITEILTAADLRPEEPDFYVLHQPNKYILKNLQRRLGLDDGKLPSGTQSVYGNQNSASIPGTISGFLAEDFSHRTLRAVFAGFGVGLSWGACAIATDRIYAPPVMKYEESAR
ncbi:ketoacyl-ACP synthase III [Methylobacterium radiotolerans]|uniref:ketoacyl-ACP synthase III n=1 Tax=Methylobacterium radiotolerans TaxID=31998 RepID=UPI000977C57B|nr:MULTISPECIES: ketoacyl-ACP synthase III [Methylobacterium]MDE3749505.1 ketoacyl-ACP synthase III [Methylobacterium radiotolerans]ONF48366.1 beta-ketoacyl-ACP reductase [Methylobacterium radiotolerans]PVY94253.1 3-oxoacyl-[acyl-carrier-protein] synthase-3 [Methylobacterium organophilum]